MAQVELISGRWTIVSPWLAQGVVCTGSLGLHSSTSQLNLSRIYHCNGVKSPNVSNQECLR